MSNIWIFSPSSEVHLKRCKDLILTTPADSNNKWVKRFKKKDTNLDKTSVLTHDNNKINILEVCNSDPSTPEADNRAIIESKTDDELRCAIELEPLTKFDSMVLECLKTPETIDKLARDLSVSTIEKISNYLFSKIDINPTFLEMFYTNFIPIFLKRQHCRFSLDLLVNAHKAYPDNYIKTLNVILKDLDIQNTLLNDFAHTLDDDCKLKLIKHVSHIELTPEQFQYNLFTIYTLYRECKKDSTLQTSMETLLFVNSEFCSKDNNFGKLLLTYLQEQKNFGAFKQSLLIEKAIEINRTPFKRPCLNAFKYILENFN